MDASMEWSRAYARQAEADFEAFLRKPTQLCHRLQLLQMACEKLVKAYLCGQGADPRSLQKSHAYVARNLPIILAKFADHMGMAPQFRKMMPFVKHLAQEIELLAPAVKRDGQRPDNCEYPWEDDQGQVHLPLDWSFAASQMLSVAPGLKFVKFIGGAIRRSLLS